MRSRVEIYDSMQLLKFEERIEELKKELGAIKIRLIKLKEIGGITKKEELRLQLIDKTLQGENRIFIKREQLSKSNERRNMRK